MVFFLSLSLVFSPLLSGPASEPRRPPAILGFGFGKRRLGLFFRLKERRRLFYF